MMLKEFLSPGTEYIKWTYLRGELRDIVWLSSEYPEPNGKLLVILKSSYPVDAVKNVNIEWNYNESCIFHRRSANRRA
jgi:hypothetical protein